MPKFKKTVFSHHSAEELYNLVINVEEYPLFLKNCKSAEILERGEDYTKSQVKLDYEFQGEDAQRTLGVREHSRDSQNSSGSFKNGTWYYFIAKLAISFKHFAGSYVSKVEHHQSGDNFHVRVSLVEGPFKYLHNSWDFIDHGDTTEIRFEVDSEFESFILEKIAKLFMSSAAEKMMESFEERADQIYT